MIFVKALILLASVAGIFWFAHAIYQDCKAFAFEWWRDRNRYMVNQAGKAWETSRRDYR